MPIQLYNTLTRSKEVFQPLQANKVSMYVCGPTVYNYIHIGNGRSAVAFDVIRRYFEYRGYEVTYISNFTDVDDKIIRRGIEENLSPIAVANKYIEAFKQDTQSVNVKEATVHPRVTENIPEIIDFIRNLIQQDFAYESEGDVYFRTEKFEKYGALSDQSIKDLLVGASERLDNDISQRKESALDFALWKSAKAGEIAWESPWGKGRPGWHIECSVMAMKYLGHTIDIHGGGQDLAFPHHENEIAQSECCTGHTFANYWLHNGFVTIGKDEEKMSKSLGNFVLLRDLLEQTDPMVVRYLLATVHYRRPLKYDQAALQEAQVNIDKLAEVLRKIDYRLKNAQPQLEADQLLEQEVEVIHSQFIKVMDDDFNASNGMTEVFNLVKFANLYLEDQLVSANVLTKIKKLLVDLLDIFGISFTIEELLDQEIQDMIDARNQARSQKDYAKSDAIRDELKAKGILLDDTPQGTQWKRIR